MDIHDVKLKMRVAERVCGEGVGIGRCGVGATKLVSLWGKSVQQELRVAIFKG